MPWRLLCRCEHRSRCLGVCHPASPKNPGGVKRARGVRALHSPEVLLQREHHPQKFTQEPQNLSSLDAKEMCLVIFFAYVFVGAKDGYLKLQKDTHADRLRTTSTSSDKREATCTARISACIGRQDRMISSNHAEGSWCQCLLEELEAMNLPISRHCH